MRTLFFILVGCAVLAAHGADAAETLSPLYKIHPPFTHFAVAFPVAVLVVALFQIWRRHLLDHTEFLLFGLAVAAVIVAAITGWIAHEAIEPLPIKNEAQVWLHRHEILGIGLALYFMLLFGLRYRLHVHPPETDRPYRLYLLLLGAGVFALLAQGAVGGMLVYDFGVGACR